ncbi:hypothetical protein QF034_007345 [Streptomyces africanus]|uniref:UspA domain-containing protein n=1 Tax=Streptomyces africanus TaxID=231024 RepID=A0ABU0R0D5_9ACTN|nr:hypothetical protein [Streptomyces africanus]
MPTTVLVREGHIATVLILGSRGRGDVAELLLGSVSLTVAGRADCPVIVVRGGHDDGSVLLDASHGADLRGCDSAWSLTRRCITPRVRSPWCPNACKNGDRPARLREAAWNGWSH